MNITWLKFFDEMLSKILESHNKHSLAKLALEIFGTSNFNDKFKDGSEGLIKEIDPLTFIGFFNRNQTESNRIQLCKLAKSKLGLNEDVPKDFNGIPIINAQKSWFFPFEVDRKHDDIDSLWEFSRKLNESKLDVNVFKRCLAIKNVREAKLTQLAFIVKPNSYYPLDKFNLDFLEKCGVVSNKEKLSPRFDFNEYIETLGRLRSKFPNKSFAELSHDAKEGPGKGIRYWLLGAMWGEGASRKDKSDDFIRDGEWVCGYGEHDDTEHAEKTNERVNEIQIGDLVAIKSAFVKEKRISCIRVKAVGVVTSNARDGRHLKVDWIFKGPSFDIDGASYMQTIHEVTNEEDQRLIYKNSYKTVRKNSSAQDVPSTDWNEVSMSKNIIFWGPPGTGKTHQLLQLQKSFLGKKIKDEDHLTEFINELSWWEVIAVSLMEFGKPVNIADLQDHKFIKEKISQSNLNKARPGNVLWSQLQNHAYAESKTVNVNLEKRQEPLIFDKTEDSKWFLTNNWKEQLNDLVVELERYKKGQIKTSTDKRFRMVTFHQSYSYEEFVEGFRPQEASDGSGMIYKVQKGIFREICEEAEKNPDEEYAIFIDEINRGNISKIFGELITLIEVDKRISTKDPSKGTRVLLPYSKVEFGVPENLYIFGTMNSVDRSVALVDMALRRRFEFKSIRPSVKHIKDGTVHGVNIRSVFTKLNQKISVILGGEYQIGHSYFMNENVSTKESLKLTWFSKILPLLQEYLFDDWEKLGALVGGFVTHTEVKELEKISLPKYSYGSFISDEIEMDKFISMLQELE